MVSNRGSAKTTVRAGAGHAARASRRHRGACARTGASAGAQAPALASALSFYDGYRCAESGANLIQAQRDYFGNHTYERTDRPRGEFFHTDWTGTGTGATSGIYSA